MHSDKYTVMVVTKAETRVCAHTSCTHEHTHTVHGGTRGGSARTPQGPTAPPAPVMPHGPGRSAQAHASHTSPHTGQQRASD